MGNSKADQNATNEKRNPQDELAKMNATKNWKAIGKKKGALPWGRWTHQYDAFEFAREYLKHTVTSHTVDARRAPKSALIRMPTGTGKTGVMALLAGYAGGPVAENIILVIVPSKALRSQVREAIEWRYWTAVCSRPKFWRPVKEFIPNTLHAALSADNTEWCGDALPPVLVCTTTTISMLSGDTTSSGLPDSENEVERKVVDANKNTGTPEKGLLYRDLIAKTGLVLIDEGHREPAPAWARAVRRFRSPRILFSATPYRNDLRLFDIGRQSNVANVGSQLDKRKSTERATTLLPYRFVLPLKVAQKNRVIREITFRHPAPRHLWSISKQGTPLKLSTRAQKFSKAISSLMASDDVKHIQEWGTHHKQNDGALPLLPVKVIVRCANVDDVRAVTLALQKNNEPGSVIAIHTRFASGSPKDGLYAQVPDFNSTVAHKATFWVHQDMLIEGLDHPGFWIVALFDNFGNERSLVQQIGRILREPTNTESPQAIVFSEPAQGIEDSWRRYMKYEAEHPAIVGPEEIVERFIQSLPDYFYSSGAFRPTLEIYQEDNQEKLWGELKISARAQVLQRDELTNTPSDLELEELVQDISDRLEQRDYTTVQVLYPPESSSLNIRVLLMLRVAESIHIEPSNFFEIGFGPAALFFTGKFLFWQGPVEISGPAKKYGYAPISSSSLRTLLSKDSLVKQTSTLNTDLNTAAIRRRSMGAVDLQLSGVTLGDEGHALISTYASDGSVRRNLNFVRSRVSETHKKLMSLEKFAEWAETLAAEIGNGVSSYPAILDRYANEVSPPDSAVAAHVLIDPRPFGEHFIYSGGDTQTSVESGDRPPFSELLEATATTIELNQDEFEADFGSVHTTFRIRYKQGRFYIEPKYKDKFFSDFTKRNESTTSWKPETLLTSKASIQVVTTNGLMYTNGRFYEPRRLWGADSGSQLPAIHGIQVLGNVKLGEKGFKGDDKKVLQTQTKRNRTTWHSSSLFGMIDRKNHEIFRKTKFKPEWLVCDDMGSEYADFIALDDSADSPPRLVMIHCKMGSSKSPQSTAAGDLHIVISQALKNLGLFSVNTGMLDIREDKWNGVFNNNEKLPLIRYSRKRKATGSDIVGQLKEALRSPDVRREVWLVMGNSVSAGAITEASSSTNRPAPHTIHLLYLLQSMKASANSLGIQLRLITKP